MKHHRHLL